MTQLLLSLPANFELVQLLASGGILHHIIPCDVISVVSVSPSLDGDLVGELICGWVKERLLMNKPTDTAWSSS